MLWLRKIFLETLPCSTRSGGKIINWKKSIGEKVNFIYDEIEGEPILLLDDFMSELDINRRKNFLNNINNTQVIITCAEKIEFLKENVDYCLYQVKEGEII